MLRCTFGSILVLITLTQTGEVMPCGALLFILLQERRRAVIHFTFTTRPMQINVAITLTHCWTGGGQCQAAIWQEVIKRARLEQRHQSQKTMRLKHLMTRNVRQNEQGSFIPIPRLLCVSYVKMAGNCIPAAGRIVRTLFQRLYCWHSALTNGSRISMGCSRMQLTDSKFAGHICLLRCMKTLTPALPIYRKICLQQWRIS